MQTTQTDVLIVGSGPSGLALAAELLRRGVTAMVVDRQIAGANTSRAAVIHARTMEVLEPLGVTEALVREGIQVPLFRVRDRDQQLMELDFSQLPTAYPYALMCPQDRTERILEQRFAALGGKVQRPCELTRCVVTAGGVEAELVPEGGETQRVRARWLVGCDGMHSRVREQAGIAFAGAQYEESFLLADVHMKWPLPVQEVSLFLASAGLLVVAPLPHARFRIVATTAPDEAAPPQPSAADVQALLDERGPRLHKARVEDVVWSSRFRVHHRVAESPRKGRVLLCGDAAHVHSPAGGQGMNTGIQDAISLGAALAETLADGADARLDTWARARHAVAQDVVAMTDRMTRLATLQSGLGKMLRNASLNVAGHVPGLRRAIATNLAELHVRSRSA